MMTEVLVIATSYALFVGACVDNTPAASRALLPRSTVLVFIPSAVFAAIATIAYVFVSPILFATIGIVLLSVSSTSVVIMRYYHRRDYREILWEDERNHRTANRVATWLLGGACAHVWVLLAIINHQ